MKGKNIIYKVAYESKRGEGKGIVAYDKHTAIFPDIRNGVVVEKGIVEIDRDSYIEKSHYTFAKMRNVVGVMPEGYGSIEFFLGIGVPNKVYVGKYGESVFIKEEYFKTTYIKAFDENGAELVTVSKSNKDADNSSRVGVHYRQLCEVITSWEEITEKVKESIENSVMDKQCDIECDDLRLMYLVRCKNSWGISQLANGVIAIDGKGATLICWEKNERLYAVWLGDKLDDRYRQGSVDLKDKMQKAFVDNYLLPKGTVQKKLNFEFDVAGIPPEILDEVVVVHTVASDVCVRGDRKLLFIELNDKFMEGCNKEERKLLIKEVRKHNERVLEKLKDTVIHTSRRGIAKELNWVKEVYKGLELSKELISSRD